MKAQKGFTLIELMVVVVILGVMSATALGAYNRMYGRVVGSEALVVLKQILDAQVMYFLEHEEYYPGAGETVTIYSNDPPSRAEIQQIEDSLNVALPVGHKLDFTITHLPSGEVLVQIDASFSIFKDGSTGIRALMDRTGGVEYY